MFVRAEKHSVLLLHFLGPSPNTRGAGKYISELGSERKGNKLGEEQVSLYHRVLKYRFWSIIPGDPHSDLTGPQKY